MQGDARRRPAEDHAAPRPRRKTTLAIAVTLLLAGAMVAVAAGSGLPWRAWWQQPVPSMQLALGRNPHPVRLLLPPEAPLSLVAQIGSSLYGDARLSGSGRLSCVSCHDPAHAFAPANDQAVQRGGPDLARIGTRAVPSLAYLYRQPSFSIGPDSGDDENVDLQKLALAQRSTVRSTKTADGAASSARNLVPMGGMFWDGRSDTLQQQASGPLFDHDEMDAGSAAVVADKIQRAGYGPVFRQLFGESIFADPQQVVAEATFALVRYQMESSSFHAFTSKYDAWLQGKARLSRAEMRGYLAFTDPSRGNCAACHPAQPSRDGLPPLFTDAQYEALGVPRNPRIPANRSAAYADLGLCGPRREDLRAQTQYCGMFLTPTLRNTATRHAYFHNGVYSNLEQVLAFYNLRNVQPEKIYPTAPDGQPLQYNDLPAAYHGNVDVADPPFDRRRGDPPPMSQDDIHDIIAFLHTLNDHDDSGR